jgi:hypothetical protein
VHESMDQESIHVRVYLKGSEKGYDAVSHRFVGSDSVDCQLSGHA